MPKDEFDFDDPLELNGVALYTDEDTSRDMAECFVEEFLMLGYNHKQLLAMFRNPHYLGLNMVLQNKGEPFVREIIAETFAKWGKKIEWPAAAAMPLTPSDGERENHRPSIDRSRRREEAEHASIPASPPPHVGGYQSCGHGCGCGSTAPAEQTVSLDEHLTDPMGNPIPKLE